MLLLFDGPPGGGSYLLHAHASVVMMSLYSPTPKQHPRWQPTQFDSSRGRLGGGAALFLMFQDCRSRSVGRGLPGCDSDWCPR